MSSTISPPPVLRGEQEPRVRSVPAAVSSAGPEAVELAARAGLDLYPWQASVLADLLAERADGTWACFEAGLLVSRQNGKGAVLEARVLAGLYLLGERLIVWTAHEMKTAKEAYLRVKGLIEATPALLARVKRRGSRIVGFRQSNEDTSIELESGSRLRFMARNKSAGRGFTGDVVILDEAQELPLVAIDAVMPTMLAKTLTGNPQVIYAGTVPGPRNDAAHWTSIRDRGRAGGDPRLGWLEFTPRPPAGAEAVSVEDFDLDDLRVWLEGNPSAGYRISLEGIEDMRRTMSEEGFAREVCSIWPDSQVGSWKLIPEAAWSAATVPVGPSWMADPVTLAVEVTPDRAWASIAAAGAHPDGRVAVEVVEHRAGTDWVVPRLVELAGHDPKALLIDPRSPAGSFVRELVDEHGLSVTEVSSADYARACGSLWDALAAERPSVVHHGQVELDAAAESAVKRSLGDAWVFDRRGDTVVTPLSAATLARWGHLEIAAPEAEGFVLAL